jgi:hypothetical protein
MALTPYGRSMREGRRVVGRSALVKGCGRCPLQRIQRYARTTVHPSGKLVDFEVRSERVFFFKP